MVLIFNCVTSSQNNSCESDIKLWNPDGCVNKPTKVWFMEIILIKLWLCEDDDNDDEILDPKIHINFHSV